MSYPRFPAAGTHVVPTLNLAGFGDDEHQDNDGKVELAANWIVKKAIKQHPEIVRNTQHVVGAATDHRLTPAEVRSLTDHVIDTIGLGDAWELRDIQPTLPLTVSPRQMNVIDGLISKLPIDQAGSNARAYYRDAKKAGRIRVK